MIMLGTNHMLQGSKKHPHSIIDPLYRSLVTIINTEENVDCVFEEGTELGPTVAEEIAEEKLGKEHYLNVDLPIEKRKVLGIGIARMHELSQMPRNEVPDLWFELNVESQRKRETAWLIAIQERKVERGLFVCGLAHLLSMAFSLESSGYSAETRIYNPEHRVCLRTHDVLIPGLRLRNGNTGTETPL